MLEVKDATIAVGDKVIARNLSFTAMDGEFTCVSGSEGAGKSVLLRTLMGFLPVNEGFVSVDGELLTIASAHAFRRMMCYLPQEMQMLRHQLVAPEPVALDLWSFATIGRQEGPRASTSSATAIEEEYTIWNSVWPMANKETTPEPLNADELFALTEQTLNEAANKPIIIADEPTAHLSPDLAIRMIQLLKAQAQAGKTVLVASKSPQVVDYADKIIQL